MIFINRSELNRMAHTIVDPETEMTQLDYFEWMHAFEDWQVNENA